MQIFVCLFSKIKLPLKFYCSFSQQVPFSLTLLVFLSVGCLMGKESAHNHPLWGLKWSVIVEQFPAVAPLPLYHPLLLASISYRDLSPHRSPFPHHIPNTMASPSAPSFFLPTGVCICCSLYPEDPTLSPSHLSFPT